MTAGNRHASIALAVLLTHAAAHAQPARKDSIAQLRQDVEALRAALAVVDGRNGQQDVDLAELARRISELEQQAILAENIQNTDPVAPLTEMRNQIYAQIEQLRGELAGLEEEEVPSQVDHEGGFVWTTADEDYQLRIGGFVQARWQLDREAGDDDAGFAVRRARTILEGTGAADLGFRVMAELVEPALVEGWLEYNTGSISVRGGRDRVPFLRSGVMPEHQYAFPELAVATAAYGWDRDVGVEVRVHPRRGAVNAVIMLANGGPDSEPDDLPLFALRTQFTPIGDKPDPGAGDLEGSRLSATLGFGVVVDAVPAPASIGSIPIGGDVDGDGEVDRVVTATSALDLTIRADGIELALEGMLRFEGWGDLLAVNSELTRAIGVEPDEVRQRSMAGSAELTYLMDDVMFGVRVAGGQVPFLSMHGPSTIPPGRSVREVDGTVGLYKDKVRMFGLTYRYLDWGTRYTGGGDGPIEHTVIAEAQVVL